MSKFFATYNGYYAGIEEYAIINAKDIASAQNIANDWAMELDASWADDEAGEGWIVPYDPNIHNIYNAQEIN